MVLTVDRIDALADAILIARRSHGLRCRRSSSAWGCRYRHDRAASATSHPRWARSLQEVIDVLAIAVALRAVLPGAVHTIAMPPPDIATAPGCGPNTTRCYRRRADPAVADALTTRARLGPPGPCSGS